MREKEREREREKHRGHLPLSTAMNGPLHVFGSHRIRLTNVLVIEYLGIPSVRILASQLPNIEKWLPVNVATEAAQVVVLENGDSQPVWFNWTKTWDE